MTTLVVREQRSCVTTQEGQGRRVVVPLSH